MFFMLADVYAIPQKVEQIQSDWYNVVRFNNSVLYWSIRF